MSFLMPLYIAGILAVSLPIIFHLIKRTPTGRQAFSSLMFLAPSPPRITKRSRLSNILLLILRATALALLALAFARPFFHQKADATVNHSQGRRIGIMVDTSASMQRGDLWPQATQQVDQVLNQLTPFDEVGLFFFDRQVRTAFSFTQWNESDPSQRVALLRARLAEERPTFRSTNLGDAVATVAETVAEEDSSDRKKTGDALARQVVLISDLQQGSHPEALQAHQWPANVVLEVKTVAPKNTMANAGAELVKESGADASETPDPAGPKLRVRVMNEATSTREQISLAWANEKGPLADMEPVKVYVPPGRSRVVRIPWPAPDQVADRLTLVGDDADFDNTVYVVPLRQENVRVLYVGDDAADDIKGSRFYIERVITPTPQRKTDFLSRRSDEILTPADLTDTRLIVVNKVNDVAPLRNFIEQGGQVLWTLTDASTSTGLAKLMGTESLPIENAPSGNFALISRITFDHPLFAPFADSRFSDFTKIHFWQHRKVKLTEGSAARVIAWFDNGDPFMFEQLIGKGRLLVTTSSWQPADSQLALSTKFVPLIDGLLQRRDAVVVSAQYSINEPIALPPAGTGQEERVLTGPDGRRIELLATANIYDGADRPGIYHLQYNGQNIPIAVNLAADESRTTPFAVEDLEQWGVRMGAKPVSDETVAHQRQLQTIELENKQKLWRWLIVTVLAVLLIETVVAGKLARKSQVAI